MGAVELVIEAAPFLGPCLMRWVTDTARVPKYRVIRAETGKDEKETEMRTPWWPTGRIRLGSPGSLR
jgi:hypothetical protein